MSAASSKGRFEMARAKANILEKLREQMGFLRTSVRAFYEGRFCRERPDCHDHQSVGS